MNYIKIVFLLFGAFEVLAGFTNLTVSQGGVDELFGTVATVSPAAMIYPWAFGNGLLCVGLTSVLAFFLKERLAQTGLGLLFALFNGVAAWLILTLPGQPAAFVSGAYFHIAFTIAFLVTAVFIWRSTSTA